MTDSITEINNIIKLIQTKNFEDAEKKINELIIKDPYSTQLYNFKGTLYAEQSKNDEALENYNKSLELDPNNFKTYNNLGVLMHKLFKFKEASKYYKKSIEINPEFYTSKNNHGVTLIFLGKFDEAMKCFDEVIKNDPNNYEPHLNKGNILRNRGFIDDSIICFENALKINPTNSKIHNDFALALLKTQSNFKKSIYHLNKAIEIDPNNFKPYLNLGLIYKDLTMYEDAIINYEKAIKIKPDTSIFSVYLFTLSYMENITPSFYYSIGEKFKKSIKLLEKNNFIPYKFKKKPDKLKIGFVSGDFRNHPVGHFLIDLVNNLKSSSIELYAYNNNNFGEDDLKIRFKKSFKFWRNIFDKDDLSICNIIREDGINILIDLAGHTSFNKLSIFANKPAPIQATWIGCNISTSLTEIDYIIGDKYAFTVDEKPYFVENFWHLPDSMQCISKENFSIKRKEIPSIRNNHITFGCFNIGTKINKKLIKIWSSILKNVKNSKLLLKSSLLEEQIFTNMLIEEFKKNGVDKNSLILRKRTETRADHLQMYNDVDITLDTFPYNGCTTSHESILMGVPVLTLKGFRPHSKIGESLNSNIDMKEWIAKDEEDYFNKAIKFSRDLNNLSSVKKSIIKKIFQTSSYNTIKFSNQFEKEMWKMWETKYPK